MSNTNLFNKAVRQRGTHGGINDSATGYVVIPASGSDAGPFNVAKIGEATTVIKLRAVSIPAGVTGTFAMTLADDTAGVGFKTAQGVQLAALPAPVSLGNLVLPASGEVVLETAIPTLAAAYAPTRLIATGTATNGVAVPVRLEFTAEILPQLETTTSLASAQ